jgi:hypothetical protein
MKNTVLLVLAMVPVVFLVIVGVLFLTDFSPPNGVKHAEGHYGLFGTSFATDLGIHSSLRTVSPRLGPTKGRGLLGIRGSNLCDFCRGVPIVDWCSLC